MTDTDILLYLSFEELPSAKALKIAREMHGGGDFRKTAAMFIRSEEIISKLCNGFKNKLWERQKEICEKNGVVPVTFYSDEYPETLKLIPDPPACLYCKGNVALLNSLCFAVVGTRKASSYGRRVTANFVSALCEHFTIVSGLAYGVDAVAHEKTLENGGSTIAVLGGGVDRVYPAANAPLAEKITAGGGLIISEYPLGAEPKSYRFPQRNRIVAGLSKGVLVCEAPLKSGTFSTIDSALEQGKDVFVVPGGIYDYGYLGSNELIKSMQGAVVTKPSDILSCYGAASEDNAVFPQLNEREKAVLEILKYGRTNFDKLVLETSMKPAELNFLLANLELKSIIAKSRGNFYELCGTFEN